MLENIVIKTVVIEVRTRGIRDPVMEGAMLFNRRFLSREINCPLSSVNRAKVGHPLIRRYSWLGEGRSCQEKNEENSPENFHSEKLMEVSVCDKSRDISYDCIKVGKKKGPFGPSVYEIVFDERVLA